MTIAGRRQILGWGALGLGAMTLDGCDGVWPWAATVAMPADFERLLQALDGVKHRFESLDTPPERFGIKSGRPHVAEGQATCRRLLQTICSMGTYRDLPQETWREPRVEAHLAEHLPEVYSTIAGARNHLAEMTEDEAATIEKRLTDDPELTMRVMEQVDDYGKQLDVPIDQRMYLRTATVQLSGRFRTEGAKEVTSKLVAQYDRALAKRKAEVAMLGDPDAPAQDPDAGAGGSTASTAPAAPVAPAVPPTASFLTRVTLGKLYVATCALQPSVMLEGKPRRIQLDFDKTPCQTSSSVTLHDAPPIRGVVRMEPRADGQNVVTVMLYPPEGASGDGGLSSTVASIAQRLQTDLLAGRGGDACAGKDDCGPLHCVDGRCVELRGDLTAAPAPKKPRFGLAGESCRAKSDCKDGLTCTQGACTSSPSARMSATTKKVAIVGAWTLIPPICAIGILILLQCFFMVIVTGAITERGD